MPKLLSDSRTLADLEAAIARLCEELDAAEDVADPVPGFLRPIPQREAAALSRHLEMLTGRPA